MPEPGTTVDVDGSAGRGWRLPAEIQSVEAAQPAGLREPGDFCGADVSIPSSGRASPSLRWGWTKNKRKHKLNHVPGLTHGLDQKSEPGQFAAANEAGQLPNIDLLLPVIELRLDKFGGSRTGLSQVNFHVIFADGMADTIESQFLNALRSEYV